MALRFSYLFISVVLFSAYILNTEFFRNKNVKAQSGIHQAQTNTIHTDDGNSIFLQLCLSCHQADGSGVPGMYPPLKNSDWVNGDKNKIIKVLLNGLNDEIEVNEETYSQTMPKFDYLTDQQIAQVLTYIRQNLGNHSSSVTASEVSQLRNKNQK